MPHQARGTTDLHLSLFPFPSGQYNENFCLGRWNNFMIYIHSYIVPERFLQNVISTVINIMYQF